MVGVIDSSDVSAPARAQDKKEARPEAQATILIGSQNGSNGLRVNGQINSNGTNMNGGIDCQGAVVWIAGTSNAHVPADYSDMGTFQNTYGPGGGSANSQNSTDVVTGMPRGVHTPCYFSSTANGGSYIVFDGNNSPYHINSVVNSYVEGDIYVSGNAFAGDLALPVGGHVGNTASNSDFTGTCTLGLNCANIPFNDNYASAPVCVATDTSAANAVQVTALANKVTFSGTAPDVIAYVCAGNPN